MNEFWKPINGYQGLYEVSSLGRVKSLPRKKKFGNREYLTKTTLMTGCNNGNGYLSVTLCKDHKHKRFYIHRLVAETFIANPKHYPQINHLDENRSNNKVDNLEWCTAKHNINYGNRTRKYIRTRGKRVGQFTPGGQLINIFLSAREATRLTGIANIASCARGEKWYKTAGGFVWKYLNE